MHSTVYMLCTFKYTQCQSIVDKLTNGVSRVPKKEEEMPRFNMFIIISLEYVFFFLLFNITYDKCRYMYA